MNPPSESRFRAQQHSVAQDWEGLGRYLHSQGMHLDLDSAPRQFGGGFANLNYLLQIDGGPVVLRRPPMGPLPPGAYDMGRESRILSRLWEAFPLAPRNLHLCTDESVLGAPFQLTEFRDGISVRDQLPSPCKDPVATGARLGQLMIDTLVDLHQVDPAAVGLDSLGRPEGFLERARKGWIQRAHLCIDAWELPQLDALLRAVEGWLQQQSLPQGPQTLLHNDFKLDNMLLREPELSPVAVVDWDQGTRGDALFDLATLLSYWTEAGDPPGLRLMRQMPTEQAGFPSRREAAEAYALRSGFDLSDFRFYQVLAQLKTAVIFLQLHQRYRSGGTTDARYAEFLDVGQALLQAAHDGAFHSDF